MELKGSKTEQNLLAAFSGESMARNRYTFFASVAKKEGYEQISAIFHETADNEKEHAKMMVKFLNGIGTTYDNLKTAAYEEKQEHTVLYKEMEQVAKEEGFTEISEFFRELSEVEGEHEKRFLRLAQNIDDNAVFKESVPTQWHCRNCGHIHESTEAPYICPVCKHPRAFFERKTDNY